MKRLASHVTGSVEAWVSSAAAVAALLVAPPLVLVAVVVVGGGCTEASKNGVRTDRTEATAKTDVHTDNGVLQLLPGLGEQPTHVWWTEQTLGNPSGLGPTDRVLLVVLRFSEGDVERALSRLEARPRGGTTKVAVSALASYPSEALAGLRLDREDPQFYALSEPVYRGVGVGRSPYLNGVVARVGKDRVLVRLFTQ